jgi:tetratricopeptide (TPR) repeat protein
VKQFIYLFFIFSLTSAYSQNYDSLETIANTLKNDSDRVNLFYKEGFSKRTIDVQYSYMCAKRAEFYAQRVNLPYYVAKANNLLGILYYRKGDFKTALSYHKIALNLRTIINDRKGIGLSEANLGNIYSDLKEYKLAEQAYLKALEINNELHNDKQIANTFLNLGSLKVTEKNLDAAVLYFNKAMDIAKKINDYETQAICLNNLAVMHTSLQEYDAAIANAQNSIKLKFLTDNEIEMADSYLNIANAYMHQNEVDLALSNLKIADSIITKYNYDAAKLQSLLIKYNYYEKIKNYELAFKFLKERIALQDSIDRINADYNLENNFTETLIQAGVKTSKTTVTNYTIYYFFGLLFFIGLALLLFVFKFKR